MLRVRSASTPERSATAVRIVDQREDLVDGGVEVVVDDDVGAELAGEGALVRGGGNAPRHCRFVVAAGSQTLGLRRARGSVHEDQQRALVAGPDRPGALDVDLEQHVGALGRVGPWSAVEVPLELGPLEEAPTIDVGDERRAWSTKW
jgi:hypothetical protein